MPYLTAEIGDCPYLLYLFSFPIRLFAQKLENASRYGTRTYVRFPEKTGQFEENSLDKLIGLGYERRSFESLLPWRSCEMRRFAGPTHCRVEATGVCFVCFLLVVSVYGLSPSLAQRRTDQPRISPGRQLKPPTPEELADRLAQTLASAKFLAFDARIENDPYVVRAEVAMAPGKLKTRIFVKDELVAVFAWENNRASEYRPEWNGLTKVVLQYDASATSGSGDIKLTEGLETLGCLFGSLLKSWVGETAPEGDTLEEINFFLKAGIAEGEYLGVEDVNGRKSHVVRWLRRNGRIETFYIDADRFYLLRWDSVRPASENNPGYTWKRVYTNVVLGTAPPDFSWLLDAEVETHTVGRNRPIEGADER